MSLYHRRPLPYPEKIYYLPQRQAPCPPDELLTRNCVRCGAEFKTGSRVKYRCVACQTAVIAERQPKYNAKRKARRGKR